MSRLARVLILGAVMAAMNLAGMTAVAQAQSAHDDAVQRFRQGERASQEQPTTDEVVQRFRQGERASQEQPTTDNPTPAPAPLQPPEQTGQPGWLVAALAALAATLAVVAGLAVLAARRATRRARIGPAT
jgi:Na+(H+)/acetate symporter ActP